jgi:predicted transcriptional regulator
MSHKEEYDKISFLTDVAINIERYFIDNDIDYEEFAKENNIEIETIKKILSGNKNYTIEELFFLIKKLGGNLSIDLGLGDIR